MTESNRITAKVEGLSFTGLPFILHEGEQIIIPGKYFPGDMLSLTLELDSLKVSEIELDFPSPIRVKPDCHHYGHCSGCDLLEMSEKGRKYEKSQMMARALALLSSDVVPDFLSDTSIVRYLPRLTFYQGKNPEFRESGLLASREAVSEGRSDIVPIKSCAIAVQPINRRILSLRRILNEVPPVIDRITLMASADVEQGFISNVAAHAVLAKDRNSEAYRKDFIKIMRAADLSGLSIATANGEIEQTYGHLAIPGLVAPERGFESASAEPSVAVQDNVFMNRTLIHRVLKYVEPAPGLYVVEGFAGAGNFTLPIARKGAEIHAMDWNPAATKLALRNLYQDGQRERARIITGNVSKDLTLFRPNPDVLLLNPPKKGTKNIADILKTLKPKKVVSVFSELSTMVSDCSAIISEGYEIVEASGLDMYPRTSKVGAVIMMTKAKA